MAEALLGPDAPLCNRPSEVEDVTASLPSSVTLGPAERRQGQGKLLVLDTAALAPFCLCPEREVSSLL